MRFMRLQSGPCFPRRLSAIAAAAALALAPALSHAAGWSCWREASLRYHVPVDLLFSIAHVESHVEKSPIHWNGDGTYDIGLMQINSSWLPTLRRYGITQKTLLTNACVNLNVGAWILSSDIHRYGLNWRGVGAYNAGTPYLQALYARNVARELQRVERYGYGR